MMYLLTLTRAVLLFGHVSQLSGSILPARSLCWGAQQLPGWEGGMDSGNPMGNSCIKVLFFPQIYFMPGMLSFETT